MPPSEIPPSELLLISDQLIKLDPCLKNLDRLLEDFNTVLIEHKNSKLHIRLRVIFYEQCTHVESHWTKLRNNLSNDQLLS